MANNQITFNDGNVTMSLTDIKMNLFDAPTFGDDPDTSRVMSRRLTLMTGLDKQVTLDYNVEVTSYKYSTFVNTFAPHFHQP